jgi:molybdenum cofactor biosynthesis enzyme MoaA
MITLRFIASRLRLAMALLPLLSLSRVVNLVAAILCFLARSSRTVKHPPILVLTLTTDCNYSCVMCLKSSRRDSTKGVVIDYRTPREMSFENLERLLRENAAFLCAVRLHGGEPLHYTRIEDLTRLLNELRIPYDIVTNGALLTEELCRTLVGGSCFGISISLDAATSDTYRLLRRGGDLAGVLSNIERVNAVKRERRSRRPVLAASMCTFSLNACEMPALVRLCEAYEIPSLTVGEGWDYDTEEIGAEHLVENNKVLVASAIVEARQQARRSRVTLRTRFPSLETLNCQGMPRQVGLIAPRDCLNLYASVWILPSFDAIGCSNATASFGNTAGGNLQRVWNGRDGIYAKARVSLRKKEVPQPCEKCIYTGSFFS